MIYIVKRKHHPVFILEIKPHPNIVDKSRHNGVDRQISKCFDKLTGGLVIPRLHTVSLMGTTFSTYVLENATSLVMPQQNISSNKDIIPDLAPRPGGSMRFWKPPERRGSSRSSRMSKQCLLNSEYHLQVYLSHIPFLTCSLNDLTQTWFQMSGLVACKQTPVHTGV